MSLVGKDVERNQEATVYVGNVEEKCNEKLLTELFTQAGPVVRVFMPKDRVTQVHQGFAFVEMGSEEDADYAIRIMHGIHLHGRPIRVNKSQQDPKSLDVGANLFIGNLDTGSIDEKVLFDTFSVFGTIIHPPKLARDAGTGASLGYGFISYDSFEAADAAIEGMHGQFLANKPCTVDFAFKKDGKGEKHGSQAERLLASQAQKNRPKSSASASPHPGLVPGGPTGANGAPLPSPSTSYASTFPSGPGPASQSPHPRAPPAYGWGGSPVPHYPPGMGRG